ncbi:MobB protein (plasmid) [Brasilonema octagenarum UFV-E1]|uniref:MobB protein n=2 Tax=Brasilonema TaxID=383614 RepID=A0A856MPU0_9CYAN|nr:MULTISPECIES: MobB protein [Brasilonema]NMF64629.1 MobB protein [Brasilonema octagenarum UFV-OR1]QDL12549.1 MobB protein [Brasilonema sennae CENA114]QDL18943.1 MobB protein [Brasilonema octagenarum UFV-E1]
MKRTHRVEIALNSDEKQTIETKAQLCNVSTAQYLRDCGLRRTLMAKPPADVITIRISAGTAKSKLMMLRHLAGETNNQQILDTIDDAIALVDKTIAASFNINISEETTTNG